MMERPSFCMPWPGGKSALGRVSKHGTNAQSALLRSTGNTQWHVPVCNAAGVERRPASWDQLSADLAAVPALRQV